MSSNYADNLARLNDSLAAIHSSPEHTSLKSPTINGLGLTFGSSNLQSVSFQPENEDIDCYEFVTTPTSIDYIEQSVEGVELGFDHSAYSNSTESFMAFNDEETRINASAPPQYNEYFSNEPYRTQGELVETGTQVHMDMDSIDDGSTMVNSNYNHYYDSTSPHVGSRPYTSPADLGINLDHANIYSDTTAIHLGGSINDSPVGLADYPLPPPIMSPITPRIPATGLGIGIDFTQSSVTASEPAIGLGLFVPHSRIGDGCVVDAKSKHFAAANGLSPCTLFALPADQTIDHPYERIESEHGDSDDGGSSTDMSSEFGYGNYSSISQDGSFTDSVVGLGLSFASQHNDDYSGDAGHANHVETESWDEALGGNLAEAEYIDVLQPGPALPVDGILAPQYSLEAHQASLPAWQQVQQVQRVQLPPVRAPATNIYIDGMGNWACITILFGCSTIRLTVSQNDFTATPFFNSRGRLTTQDLNFRLDEGPSASILPNPYNNDDLEFFHEVEKSLFYDGVTLPTISTASVDTPITEFHLFPELPAELRRMIWKMGYPETRVITIKPRSRLATTMIPELNLYFHEVIHETNAVYKMSPLQIVCHESAEVFEEEYPRSFANSLGGRSICFNPAYDILYFPTVDSLGYFYGGTAPNHSPHRTGYRFDMGDFHNKVQNIMFGDVEEHQLFIGACLNQMSAVRHALLKTNHPLHVIRRITKVATGETPLKDGWENFQLTKSTEAGNMPWIHGATNLEFWNMMEKLMGQAAAVKANEPRSRQYTY